MPGTTIYALPYPTQVAAGPGPDVPADIKALADAIDPKLTPMSVGAGSPTALSIAPGKVGRRHRDSTTGDIWLDIGAAWVLEFDSIEDAGNGIDVTGRTVSVKLLGTGGGSGLGFSGGSLAVASDEATIERSAGILQIKDKGVSAAKVADALKPSAGAVAATEALRALGSAAGTAAAGNDGRLSDARTPTAHAASHRAGGSDALSAIVLSQVQIRDVGSLLTASGNLIRAGRVLTALDWTNQGLTAPLGLWNLGNTSDASGNSRTLTNKGALTFQTGITGSVVEAAIFTGSSAQAFYIVDAAWQKIQTGHLMCWFRTAKRGLTQFLMSKWNSSGSQPSYLLGIDPTTNAIQGLTTHDGSTIVTAVGKTDVCDDAWHQAVFSHDGSKMRLYVDGALEVATVVNGPMFIGTGPFNIGGFAADASTVTTSPHFGRIDEAAIGADVLSDQQVRNFYCSQLSHLLGGSGPAIVPKRVAVSVTKRRRGGTLATTDFSGFLTLLRLYNFTAGGGFADQGSNNQALTSNAGTGQINVNIPGFDGVPGNGIQGIGAHGGLSSTDTGLPSGTAVRSYGGWFCSTSLAASGLIGWGTITTNDARLLISSGIVQSWSGPDAITGPFVADGLPHFICVVEDNSSADGLKRKLFVDGKLVGTSTVLTSLTLAGAGAFRIGASPGGASPLVGRWDGCFICGGSQMTSDMIRDVYNVGSLPQPPSPKSEGDHVEGMLITSVLTVFDTLDPCDLLDIQVYS